MKLDEAVDVSGAEAIALAPEDEADDGDGYPARLSDDPDSFEMERVVAPSSAAKSEKEVAQGGERLSVGGSTGNKSKKVAKKAARKGKGSK